MTLLRRAWKRAPLPLKRAAGRFKPRPDLVELVDADAAQASPGAIPAQVLQTAPSRSIHREHAAAIYRFRDLNRDLSHRLFDQEQTDSYMANAWGHHPILPVYERALFGQIKADIFRYCIVFDQGGYYLDINKAIMQPLRDLHSAEDHALWSFEKNAAMVFPDPTVAGRLAHPEKLILQWGFGFSPQHPILELAIDRIVETSAYFGSREFNRILPTVVMFTGPGALTWAVRKYLSRRAPSGVAQHPPDFAETGITRLPKSDIAFQGAKHYSKFKHHRVLRDELEAEKGALT